MKSVRELVEEFIEGLATGSIESKALPYLDARGAQFQPAEVQKIGEFIGKLGVYSLEKVNANKDKLAEDVFGYILVMRGMGLYVNSEAQRHVEILKDENRALQTANDDLAKQLSGAMDTIKKLNSELKTGGQMFR